MKSERFKTELITNVSHDIKTPLTSIINYVDLLEKEEIPNENAKEYLEVLERQSARPEKVDRRFNRSIQSVKRKPFRESGKTRGRGVPRADCRGI